MMKFDVNSDMGEGFGRYTVGDDKSLFEIVSSANVACGFHAGDPVIMRGAVEMAKARGVGLGAHPGMPDLMGFGRRNMQVDTAEMESLLIYQIGALQGFAAAEGYRVTHVSYHAAFGNMAAANRELADVLARAIATIDRDLIMFSMPGTEVEKAAKSAGLRTITQFLADRAYNEDGSLVSRKLANSVITDVNRIKSRVRQFVESGTVTTIDGKDISIRAQSILVHSDTPGSAMLARTVRETIEECGATVAPPSEVVSQS